MFPIRHNRTGTAGIGYPDTCKTPLLVEPAVAAAYPTELSTKPAVKKTTTKKGMDNPPCGLLRVQFTKLRILEANLIGLLDVRNPGIWEHHFAVYQINGRPEHIVRIDLSDNVDEEHSKSRAFISLPIEIDLEYGEYARAVTYEEGRVYRLAFSIATGGWVNRGTTYALPIPFTEQIQGNDGDWELGDQILSASENGLTYEVEYSVRCASVVESDIPLAQLARGVLGLAGLDDAAFASVSINHLQSAIQKFGYAIKQERKLADGSLLTLEGPLPAEQLLKHLKAK